MVKCLDRMDKLKKTLLCSVCEQVLDNPRTLPCQHTFCLACIQSLISAAPPSPVRWNTIAPESVSPAFSRKFNGFFSNFENSIPFHANNSTNHGEPSVLGNLLNTFSSPGGNNELVVDSGLISCPVCSATVDTHMVKVESLRVDGYVERGLAIIHEWENDDCPRNLSCGNCDAVVLKQALAICLNCPSWLCNLCVPYHSKVKIYRNHVIVNLSEGESAEEAKSPPLEGESSWSNPTTPVSQTRCEKHAESYKLYCTECQVPVCTVCYALLHTTHKMGSIEDTANQFKEMIFEQLTPIKKEVEAIDEQFNTLKDRRKCLTEMEKDLVTNINDRAEKMMGLLVEAKGMALKNVNQQINNYNTHLNLMEAKLQTSKSTSNAVLEQLQSLLWSEDTKIVESYNPALRDYSPQVSLANSSVVSAENANVSPGQLLDLPNHCQIVFDDHVYLSVCQDFFDHLDFTGIRTSLANHPDIVLLFNVSLATDRARPLIADMLVLPPDYRGQSTWRFIIADQNNGLKAFDELGQPLFCIKNIRPSRLAYEETYIKDGTELKKVPKIYFVDLNDKILKYFYLNHGSSSSEPNELHHLKLSTGSTRKNQVVVEIEDCDAETPLNSDDSRKVCHLTNTSQINPLGGLAILSSKDSNKSVIRRNGGSSSLIIGDFDTGNISVLSGEGELVMTFSTSLERVSHLAFSAASQLLVALWWEDTQVVGIEAHGTFAKFAWLYNPGSNREPPQPKDGFVVHDGKSDEPSMQSCLTPKRQQEKRGSHIEVKGHSDCNPESRKSSLLSFNPDGYSNSASLNSPKSQPLPPSSTYASARNASISSIKFKKSKKIRVREDTCEEQETTQALLGSRRPSRLQIAAGDFFESFFPVVSAKRQSLLSTNCSITEEKVLTSKDEGKLQRNALPLQKPHFVAFDDFKNVIICNKGQCNIHIISAETGDFKSCLELDWPPVAAATWSPQGGAAPSMMSTPAKSPVQSAIIPNQPLRSGNQNSAAGQLAGEDYKLTNNFGSMQNSTYLLVASLSGNLYSIRYLD